MLCLQFLSLSSLPWASLPSLFFSFVPMVLDFFHGCRGQVPLTHGMSAPGCSARIVHLPAIRLASVSTPTCWKVTTWLNVDRVVNVSRCPEGQYRSGL